MRIAMKTGLAAGRAAVNAAPRTRLSRLVAASAMLAVSLLHPAHAQVPGKPPAAGTSWNAVLDAAKKEGQVTLYSALTNPEIERIATGFRKAYPDIRLEFLRGPSGEQLTKVEQERASGVDGADVLISTELAWFIDRAKEGRLLRPVGPALAAWQPKYIHQGTAITIGYQPVVIPYNKNLVPVPPKSYLDLLKPEFKGKLGTTELASTFLIAWYEWLEKNNGPDYLKKLRAQNPRLYVGATPTAQAIASGEVGVAAFGNTSATKAMMDKGAPVDFVVPSPALGVEWMMAVLGWSKRPNAALVLAEYVLSREGQGVWHSRGETASPLPNIPGSLDASSVSSYDPAAYTPEVVKKYRDYWSAIFK